MITDFPTTLVAPAHGFDSAFVDSVKVTLADAGLVRIARFPAHAPSYISLLSIFGEPLRYYGDDAGTHPEHSAIWRVRYEPAAAANGKVHAMAGPLSPHSSQSMRWPRPPFFSMLMVDQGWQGNPPGKNGESLLVRWSEAIKSIKADDSGTNTVAELFSDIPFPDGTAHPVAYKLATAQEPDDIGVRLKSDLLDFLKSATPTHPGTRAVERLSATAARVAKRVQLASGDLLLLDNDRWGHGRESVAGLRTQPNGEMLLNPRELWSVTIG
jgi:hypothetical protein